MDGLTPEKKKELKKKLIEIKIQTIRMLEKAKSGHIGGAFSLADVLTYLYYSWLKVDPTNPGWQDRDYLLLSNGHVCPIWYSILGDLGFFEREEMDRLRQIDSLLQGHPKSHIPGVENSYDGFSPYKVTVDPLSSKLHVQLTIPTLSEHPDPLSFINTSSS